MFGQPQLIIARPKRTFRMLSESRAWNRSSGSLVERWEINIGIGTVKLSNGRLPLSGVLLQLLNLLQCEAQSAVRAVTAIIESYKSR